MILSLYFSLFSTLILQLFNGKTNDKEDETKTHIFIFIATVSLGSSIIIYLAYTANVNTHTHTSSTRLLLEKRAISSTDSTLNF